MVDNRDYKIIGILGLGAIILAFLLIPINNSRHVTATDVSNDQPPIFLSQTINNSGGSSNTNTTIPCTYNIFTNTTFYFAKNCSTGLLQFSSSDASTVINEAINATTHGEMIYINQGDYIINKTSIELHHGTNIMGVSSSQHSTSDGVGTHIELANNANINLMEYKQNSLGYFIHLNNLYLDGNFANNAKGNGTYFNVNASDVEIENTYIDGFPQNCVSVDNAFNYRLLGSTFEHCKNDGLFVAKGTDMYVGGSKFLTNTNRGVEIGTTSNGITGFMLEGDYIAGNLNNNFISFNSPNEVLVGNYFQEVANNPVNFHVVLENACSNSIVNSNSFVQAGTTMNGAIDITHASCSNTILSDNSIQGTYTNAIQNSGTGTMIRDNFPNTLNNNPLGGLGITVTKSSSQDTVKTNFANGTGIQITGTTQQTFTNTGIISNSCTLGIICSGNNPSLITSQWEYLGQNSSSIVSNNPLIQNSGTATTITLDNINKATGEHVNAGSAMIGMVVNTLQISLGKTSSPTGTLSACILDSSNNCKFTFASFDASLLTSSCNSFVFTNPTTKYTIVQGDFVGVKFTNGDSTNKVNVCATTTADAYDTTKSARAVYTTSWQADTTTDLGSSTQSFTLNLYPNVIKFTTLNHIFFTLELNITSASVNPIMILNEIDDTHYSWRYSSDGSADATGTSQNSILPLGSSLSAGSGDNVLCYGWLDNYPSVRKGLLMVCYSGSDTDSGTAPHRIETSAKFNLNNAQVNEISLGGFSSNTGKYGLNTKITVWGYN